MTTQFRLREVMDARGLDNLSDLARLSGVSYPTVRGIYHNNTTRVDLATLDALARVLGCEPGELLAHKRGKAR